MTLHSAVSPNRGLVAVYCQPKDATSKRLIIKCYDSHVSIGNLKFTLSANFKDDVSSTGEVLKLHFASNDTLLASLSNGKILVFDMTRGVHSQSIDVATTTSGGDLCAFTGRDNLAYALVRKEGKVVVFAYDTQKEGKVVKKIKGGSCDEDDRLGIAMHPTKDLIALCVGKKIKIIQYSNGSIVGKYKVKCKDEGKVANGEKECILQFSPDGAIVLATTPTSVNSISTKSGKRIGLVNLSDVSSIHIVSVEERHTVAIVTKKSKAILYEVNSASEKNSDFQPISTITLPTASDSTTIINETFFAPGKQGKFEAILLELAPRGINNVDVSMQQITYRNHSNNKLQTGDLYPVDAAKKDGQGADETSKQSKKRKTAASNIVLGPGESGSEALVVTDQATMKRAKLGEESKGEDEEDFELEEGDEAEESIAQRLALLSSELDRDTEDEEELLKIQNGASNKFIVKNATSDSLSILLRQSLMANDDSQLEVALQVSDKRVIENSIFGLANDPSFGNENDSKSEIIIMLLTKLVTRLSRKPSRAERLAFWIRTVLVALLSKIGSSSAQMGTAEKEIASRLGPLRNMLSERVESLPELLRLEGRLSLLSTQF